MATHQTIEIDLDIHKLIEAERHDFNENSSGILRRLLGIDGGGRASAAAFSVASVGEGRAWSGKGVELPHATQLRMTYNGKQHVGTIDDGAWLVEGGRYNSPSAAAHAVARTKAGKPAHVDGWEYWQALRPGDRKWRLLDEFRKERGN